MRILRPLIISLTLLSPYVFAQEFQTSDIPKEKYSYQSDISRLRKIVINSLYSHRDIFLRELISNANDAIEKLRLMSLTNREMWDGVDPLNITIKAVKNEDGPGGRLIISDTGIGMTPDELMTNLGTLAKSGTAEFLAEAEGQDSKGSGNLIGAFGLGFYSSFLVADQVHVSSIGVKTPDNPTPMQHVFSSNSDDNSFEIFPDPRGNTLGRGTEITLILKDDSFEYLDTQVLAKLVAKHSSFSTAFPIYLFSKNTKLVPDEDPIDTPGTQVPLSSSDHEKADETEGDIDQDEAVVEDFPAESGGKEAPSPKTKQVAVEEWNQLNSQLPLWMRDPKEIPDVEYGLFYQSTFKDFKDPLAWDHFSGDVGTGISFRAIIFVPSELPETYWQQQTQTMSTSNVRLMVKHVFITSDLGEYAIPKWASWVKVVVDADELPLNVSRETLQSTLFLKQIRQVILKHLIALIARIAKDDREKFDSLLSMCGGALKLGAVEDMKNRDKLTALTRFSTNQRTIVSFDEYLETRKQGQKQIFYLAGLGTPVQDLAKSVFIEKLSARGYEVLLLNEPLDEILLSNIRQWKGIPFQDVAKAGLKFGDEDLDPEEQKEEQKILAEKFKPLLVWLKVQVKDIVQDVVISNRLVSSPCAVVADIHGYTANVERMILASNSNKKGADPLRDFGRKQKLLEINPKSPLIDGLLRRVEQLPFEDEEPDIEAEDELKEVASILIDGALVRSGFEVPDSNLFFSSIDRVLRRSLGVSETAPTDTTVKPAPPVDPKLPENGEEKAHIELPPEFKDKMSIEMEEIDEEGNVVHDEL